MFGVFELLIGMAVLAFAVILIGLLFLVLSDRPSRSPEDTEGYPRLVRVPQRGMLGGVCAGFAYKVGFPTWMFRVAMVLLVLMSGTGLLAYILLWFFMPKASHVPDNFDARTERI